MYLTKNTNIIKINYYATTLYKFFELHNTQIYRLDSARHHIFL